MIVQTPRNQTLFFSETFTRYEKLEQYFEVYSTEAPCTLCDTCFKSICDVLAYSDNEREYIEFNTRAQHKREHWLAMRHGIVTASAVKDVFVSTNFDKTTERILARSRIDDENPPPPNMFGRKFKALPEICFIKNTN